jgi:hypothetical protein
MKPLKEDYSMVALEIANAILAATAPGTIPSHELLLKSFVDAYETFGLSDADIEHQHQAISDQVRALITVD